MLMQHIKRWSGVGVAALLLVACQQRGDRGGGGFASHSGLPEANYRGYKMAPYKLRGMRFVPMGIEHALRYNSVGVASYYEANGARGALGQRLYKGQLYAAHRTLPLPCIVRVTNLENGKSCLARVADRGPYVAGRLIDVSAEVAHRLHFHTRGLTRVRVQVVSVGDGPYRRRLTNGHL